MKKTTVLLTMLLAAALCFNLCACGTIANNDQTETSAQNTQASEAPTETAQAETEETTAAIPETTTVVPEETTSAAPEETTPEISVKDPIDIETIGGVVISRV